MLRQKIYMTSLKSSEASKLIFPLEKYIFMFENHLTGLHCMLESDQPCIFIFLPTVTKILKWGDKNRAFSKFRVNSQGEISP